MHSAPANSEQTGFCSRKVATVSISFSFDNIYTECMGKPPGPIRLNVTKFFNSFGLCFGRYCQKSVFSKACFGLSSDSTILLHGESCTSSTQLTPLGLRELCSFYDLLQQCMDTCIMGLHRKESCKVL